MAEFIRSDLEFILEQIRIAEAHAAGTPLQQLIANPTLSFGLRTVDGSDNNLVAGQSGYGSADQTFPRMTTPSFRDADGGTSYEQTSGNVLDSQPRTISNLIVDQSAANPAAVAADGNGDGVIENVTPDGGLSAPFNSWFTLFGQFFDHGLDLVTKGGSGTVFIPLKEDDPLYVPGSPTNFMVLTRATNQPGPDGVLGTGDDVHEHTNTTTPFVDQNQTYTSHPSHQVFLREYVRDAEGRPVATGRLIENRDPGADGTYYTEDDVETGGLATWAVVKAQAAALLGIELYDGDVINVPLLATDPYGNFLPGPNGFPQLVTSAGLVEGNPLAPIETSSALRTGHAFLDDIAHTAAPFAGNGSMKAADTDDVAGVDDGDDATYDDELLGAHYITGDGRGNENIGLTAVHHVFHAEHNRLAQQVKDVILASDDLAFLAEWLLPGTAPATFPVTPGEIAALQWNGERVFQAAKFGTEMQYQHLVFEEFARKVQPAVNVFDAYQLDIDPAIVAEFAHTVYRFGHSMLNETVDRIDADGNAVEVVGGGQMGLIEAFLNPLAYAEREADAGIAAGEIVRGMTRQVGNEIDEFVTEALRNNLLGLPLDLAAINLARGRDAGIPSLNAARREFFEGTGGDSQLRPYESWVDFGLALKHPESLINFVAAYGTHPTILAAETVADKRAAAFAIVMGTEDAPADALDFMNGLGDWQSDPDEATITGLDDVDFWIGGLAEKQMPFGGLLGSTFNFVFETQLEALQDGDRFYYLARTAGLNFFTELEQASFAEMVMRNTGTSHLPADVFSTPAHIIERSDPDTWPAGEVRQIANGIRYIGADHVVLGGTAGNDRLFSSEGDDTLYGDDGNDTLEGGAGNDTILGGIGNDRLTDSFGDDVIQGGDGRDTVNAGAGLDLVLGGNGDDFLNGGEDDDELFGGRGSDKLLGDDGSDTLIGNEGDDWFEGGASGDGMIGDNDHPFGLSTINGHDVFIGGGGADRMHGEHGDDIFVGGEGADRHEGMTGFDWMTYELDNLGITADLTLRADILAPPPPSPEAILDRFNEVEGLSGSSRDDILLGDDRTSADLQVANAAGLDNVLRNDALIDGLSALIGGAPRFDGGNIILGGAGSDTIEGRGGDDLIDGDAYLHVALTARTAAGQIIRQIVTAPAGDDIDTAVYSQVLANYDITNNLDGTFTVAHARGNQADGVDTLRHVERLRFADQTLNIVQSEATGTVLIDDTTPDENQLLSATQAFTDLNGINAASIVLTWQAETAPGEWTDVGVGETYQPGSAQAGQSLRVRATFTDLLGNPETIVSAATDPVLGAVNIPASGAPAISDASPTEGETLTASPGTIAVADGLVGAIFSYAWQVFDGVDWVDIGGATGATFTPTPSEVGQPIRVVATFTDDGGSVEQVVSAPTAVVGDFFDDLGGANLFDGTEGADTAFGRAGNDTMTGNGGDDVLNGNGGIDTIAGGDGDDQLIGGDGNDVLDGGADDDVLNGGNGVDRLTGGSGNDTLIGGAGSDILVFAAGFGSDTVTNFDFNPTGGQDLLDLTALDITAATFAASVSIAQSGANTVVTIGGDQITLTNVSAGGVTVTDFLLDP